MIKTTARNTEKAVKATAKGTVKTTEKGIKTAQATSKAVSYTHLDVYKRQTQSIAPSSITGITTLVVQRP